VSARILVVEDEAPIAEVLVRTLRGHGHNARLATSGKSALLAIAEEAPGLLLLDVNLPDLTGWELLRRLSPVDRERIPVIVFSAAPLAPSRIEEFQPAGVLIKPFPMQALLRLVEELTASPVMLERGLLNA
jgi:DNA-binding response OmpR family regulator